MTDRRGPLPNLVIAGVAKAGTTSLFSYLSRHPAVCGSTVKSTQHFLPLRFGKDPAPLEEYRSFFAGCGTASVVMEATPGYFYGGHAVADELRRSIPGVKIVITLREPVSRLVSFFRFQQAMLAVPLDLTFEAYVAACEAIEPERFCNPQLADPELSPWLGVQGGRYDAYLPAWLQFGPDLCVVYFEDLTRDPQSTLTRLARWLDIDPAPFAATAFPRENRTVVPRRPGVQRVAFGARRTLDGVIRSHPKLASSLRATYYRLNGTPTVLPPVEATGDLQELFRASNQRTAELLRAAGITPLAGWLEAASR